MMLAALGAICLGVSIWTHDEEVAVVTLIAAVALFIGWWVT